MEWTKDSPERPGYYWVRNYETADSSVIEKEPEIVYCILEPFSEIPMMRFMGQVKFSTIYGEFYGPLEPPKENK